jgi:hypothetical protein
MAIAMSISKDPEASSILTGVTIVTSVLLAVIFLRLLLALTLSERVGSAGFGQLVGDLKEA